MFISKHYVGIDQIECNVLLEALFNGSLWHAY